MKQLKFLLGFVFYFTILNPLFAITVNLYEQPKKDSKVVGTIDSEIGMIPIFTPKEGGEWVKVGDPRNGNVGWITSSDLKSSNTKGPNFSFRVITTGTGPNSYQIVQFGAPHFSTEQANALLKKMELKQQQLQKDMQKMVNDLFNQSDVSWPSFPIIPHVNTQQTRDNKPINTPQTRDNKPINTPVKANPLPSPVPQPSTTPNKQ